MDKKKWAMVGVCAALAITAGATYWGRGAWDGASTALALKLDQPDAWLQTQSLSTIPRDLVAMPGLQEILTKDFVLYYEEHPDRLSLEGTLKRMAFENPLNWKEALVADLLDAPADVGLYQDSKGRLAYAAVRIKKNTVVHAMEQIAKVSLPDSQLSVAGEIRVDGDKVTVYALQLHGKSTWLMASKGEHMLVLTHPGMLLNQDRKLNRQATQIAQRLLGAGADDGANVWHSDFQLNQAERAEKNRSSHSLSLKVS